jgi:hypothetical protein
MSIRDGGLFVSLYHAFIALNNETDRPAQGGLFESLFGVRTACDDCEARPTPGANLLCPGRVYPTKLGPFLRIRIASRKDSLVSIHQPTYIVGGHGRKGYAAGVNGYSHPLQQCAGSSARACQFLALSGNKNPAKDPKRARISYQIRPNVSRQKRSS